MKSKKTRKFTALFLALLMAFGFSSAVSAASARFSGGTGDPGNPYIITTPAELDQVRDNLNKYFKLGNDINLTTYLSNGNPGYNGGAGWNPIGASGSPFTGGFAGNGYKITGLWLDRTGDTYVGLFGMSGGTVENLGVEIASAGVKGFARVGGLVGQGGDILNCYVTGNVSGTNIVGGLTGYCGGTISGCYATGDVYANGSQAGGFAGYQASGTITNCYATGNISTASNASQVGGFAGFQNSGAVITNCYATGTVSAYSAAGGFAGNQNSNNSISNCFATGDVTSTGGAFSNGILWYQQSSGNSLTNNYRYDGMKINGAVSSADEPNGKMGGIKTAAELTTKATYEAGGWVFGQNGPWYWDGEGYPKLNIGTEKFPFSFDKPIATTYPVTFSVVNGNGSLTAAVDGGAIASGASVAQGKNVVFTAVPASGYQVKEWKDNSVSVNGTNAAYTVPGILAEHTVTVEFEKITSAFLYGDLNDDGRINMSDLFILARYIANWPGYEANTFNMLAADVNANGRVNMSDLFILARHIANWPGYEVFPYID